MSISPESSGSRTGSKPYFVPADLDFEGLPVQVQLAIQSLIVPLYEALVLGAVTQVERSIASSFAMLATVELDAQFELGATLNFSGKATPEVRAERDRLIERMISLVGAKQRTAQFVHRVKALREKSEAAGL